MSENPRLDRIEQCLFGNGQPGLEDRMRKYVDERDTHKENQLRQEIMDLRVAGDERHRENSPKLDQMLKWQSEVMGAFGFGKWLAGFLVAVCVAILALLSYLAASRPHSVGESHPSPISSTQSAPQHAGVE